MTHDGLQISQMFVGWFSGINPSFLTTMSYPTFMTQFCVSNTGCSLPFSHHLYNHRKRSKLVDVRTTPVDLASEPVTFRPYSDCGLLPAREHILCGRVNRKRKGDRYDKQRTIDQYVGWPKKPPGMISSTERQIIQDNSSKSLGNLFPEILTMIFEYLSVADKGTVQKVCTQWRDASNRKCVWKNVEARLDLSHSNSTLFASLVRRGIKRVQILSMRRSLKDLVYGMPNLSSLSFSGCYNLSENAFDVAFKGELINLKELNLSLCKEVTDNTLSRIASSCKNVEFLDLAGCFRITNLGLMIIACRLKNVNNLNLRSCRNISDYGISHLAGFGTLTNSGVHSLKQLSLQDCRKITDEALKYISEGLPCIHSINLSFCVSVTDTGIKYLSRLSSLRNLNLRSCDNVSDIGVGFLAAFASSANAYLSTLDVSFCAKVTDKSLKHIASGLPRLECLSVATCLIGDEGIAMIAKNLSESLSELYIGQCFNVSDVGLDAIAQNMRVLTILDLYGCTKTSQKGIDKVLSMKCLKKLNLTL